MLLIIAKLSVSIVLLFALGSAILPALNFIDKKLNKQNEEMNEIMTITTMLMIAPLFVIIPLFA